MFWASGVCLEGVYTGIAFWVFSGFVDVVGCDFAWWVFRVGLGIVVAWCLGVCMIGILCDFIRAGLFVWWIGVFVCLEIDFVGFCYWLVGFWYLEIVFWLGVCVDCAGVYFVARVSVECLIAAGGCAL